MSKRTPTDASFANVPGKARLTVTVFPPGVPTPTVKMPDGKVVNKPVYTLAEARQIYWGGGLEGEVTDPFTGRQRLRVSLQPWATSDPQGTHVMFEWQFHPKHPIAPEHQHLFNNFELEHDLYATETDDVVVRDTEARNAQS
jgi:hypothetical protein